MSSPVSLVYATVDCFSWCTQYIIGCIVMGIRMVAQSKVVAVMHSSRNKRTMMKDQIVSQLIIASIILGGICIIINWASGG